MGSLSEIYIKKETLQTMIKTLDSKGANGLSLTISTNDDVKEFTTNDGKILQQNIGVFVSQSKEDRDASKQKYYVANGRQVWDNGNLAPSLKLYKDENVAETPVPKSGASDDLPF